MNFTYYNNPSFIFHEGHINICLMQRNGYIHLLLLFQEQTALELLKHTFTNSMTRTLISLHTTLH